MRIVILSHYFPPEVSAGATRFHEMARIWVADGHEVTVVTGVPNHPAGVVYPGYRNRLWQRETIDGINVLRLWTFLAPNRGFFRRIASYASYPVATTLAAPFLSKADVLIATTPHFFNGLAGYPVSRIGRVPWVLDIRDLWPDSIVAVGAMRPSIWVRLLEAVERFGYRRTAHIVSASAAFLPHFAACGIETDKVSVVTNGVDLELFAETGDPKAFRNRHQLGDKFVAAYVGTHGMAHQLDVVLDAADRLRARTDIAFLLVGDGAERARLLERCRAMSLSNVLMLPPAPRKQIPEILAASDTALVTLRPTPLFELVVPSKMFEAMVMRRPIILGVRGEAQRIVEGGECGLAFAPGDGAQLAERVVALADDPALRRQLGENGYRLVTGEYDRKMLAARYLEILRSVVDSRARGRDLAPSARS
jgi:glycosyltransferase involved in cell wall biosynthesis